MSHALEKEHLDLLIQASSMLNSSLDLNRVLSHLLRQATVLVGAESGHILVKENGEWSVLIAIGGESESDAAKANYSVTVAEKAIESLSTVCLLDARSDPLARHSTSIQIAGVRSILCAPLIWKRSVRGVIYLENRFQEGVFQEREVSLIEALSQQAATALENAALYQEREGVYERALAEARQELAITQVQLLNNSKLAAIGELAAGVAHEVNNPLCALSLNLNSVKESVTDPKIGVRIGLMEQAVDRCRIIVERLLNYTHPDRSQWGVTNLREVVDQTLELMSYQLKDVVVNRELCDAEVWGCASSLGQVVMNLVQNALHSFDREGVLTVSVVDGWGGPKMVVEDDGSGMTDETRRRAFEPFFTTKAVGKGTGLGLAVCYQILSQHRAKVSLESEVGTGTTMTVVFPTLEQGREG